MTTTTQVFYSGNGSQVQFTFPFDYIDQTHIKVAILNDATGLYDEKAQDDATYGWSLANASTVEFNTAPPAPTGATANIKLYRQTDSDAPYAVFTPGSPIKSVDLNDNFEQSIYVVQEATTSAGDAEDAARIAANAALSAQSDATQAQTDAAQAQADAAQAQADAAQAAADAAVAQAVKAGLTPIYNTPGDDQSGINYLLASYPFDVNAGVTLPDETSTWESNGAIRYNDSLNKIELYEGTQGQWITAAGGAQVASTPPTPATEGDVWYDPADGRAYVYYTDSDSSQWVEMNPSWNGSIADGSVTPAKLDRSYVEGVNVKTFGATGDGVTDDTAAIQAALDYALSQPGRTTVSLANGVYKVTDELFVRTNTFLEDGTIDFIPTADNKTALNIGTRDGSYLVRPAGITNVTVKNLSTRSRITGFNFGHLARGCFINNCRAEMGNGGASDYGNIGFSIEGIKASDVVSGAGTYQNSINGCSAYDCKIGYLLDTAGYGESGWQPEANGNFINSCSAYSCRTSALYLGEGAQENHISLRADTFISQNGDGTTIRVVDVLGSYNVVEVSEEIGARADTQYTAVVRGPWAIYNTISYSTQQVVTAAVLDDTNSTNQGKNVFKGMGRPQALTGGDVSTVTGYISAAASSNQIYNSFIANRRCLLVSAYCRAVSTPASYTRFYFAKNGSVDTVQRLVFSSGDAPGTVKSLKTDPTARGVINPNFIYAEGEPCSISVDQDVSGGNILQYTLIFKYLD